MPRRPRGLIVNSIVHVIARGNRGAPIYQQEQDYRAFLQFSQEYVSEHSARVHAYCLMSNHFHLLVEVGETPLSRLMHALLNRFAKYFNRMNGFRGHLFGDRFWAKPCDSEAYALASVMYIHLNPCRAGITPYADAYPWSTHRVYLGASQVPWVATTLLDLLSANRERAHARYTRLMAEAAPEPFRDRVFE
ncbi:MAG TPA: transposase [bacterium]|jgi:REP element-mobilizing transposase RayT